VLPLIFVVAMVGALFIAGTYNTLVRRRNTIEQAWSGIDVQLTQRYDLIPKLVETVKQYMTHERSLLEDIVRLRSNAVGATSSTERVKADNQLTQAMGKLTIAVENYPQLKASETFVMLQRSLNEVEEQLAAARRSFNAAVMEFNNAVQMFPSSIIAGMMGFSAREMFVADQVKRGDVDMKALFKA
jgi:LemA protein